MTAAISRIDKGHETSVNVVLIGTTNAGKREEYETLLTDLPITWQTLSDVALDSMDVEETGATFMDNALLKARAYAAASGLAVLADDSGIAVDALDGAPGIYSARYAPTVAERNTKLLDALKDIPYEQRTAQFVCAIALVTRNGLTLMAEGKVAGHVGFEPRGTNGHGYDPVFVLSDGRTLAELYPAEKNAISHRGKALAMLHPLLRCLYP